jgi:hypothetical protein
MLLAHVTLLFTRRGRGDYTIANNYQPISILLTLGKTLESLVAKRIAYLVEEYRLLLKAHFSARK